MKKALRLFMLITLSSKSYPRKTTDVAGADDVNSRL
jgi:hypothetical protein